jgi:hypothetical protein
MVPGSTSVSGTVAIPGTWKKRSTDGIEVITSPM